ncbi:MAG TPA: polysaccharide biosynthesis C-terminal domain-containing protein [Pelobium sp.]|nr:polysaccharide biosynthesis C-terminal domain-containing protein [Pelobium sp.]
MDNKKFASRVTLLVLVNLLVKIIWIFFIERKVQLNVGFQDFGLYYSVYSFTLILGVINDPGLNNYLIQYLSKGKHHTQHIATLFYLKTFLAGIYIIITFLVGLLLGYKNYDLLGLLIMYQILYSSLNYLRSFLKSYQLLNAEIVVSVLDKGLLIIAFLPILYFNSSFSWTINFYITTHLVALSISLLMCGYYLLIHKISILPKAKIKLNFSVIKRIAPFAVFAFLVLAYNKIDTVMLAKMLPDGNMQNGIYVAAYRFLDATSMLPILFATLFYPIICKIISDSAKVNEAVKNSLSGLIPLTIIISIVSWFYRFQIMTLLYHQNNSEQLSLIFGVLMLSLPLIVVYYVFSTVFTASNNLKLLNLISAGGLLINIGLNILLIPVYQALGAAISSLASFCLIGLAYAIFYHLHFKNTFQLFLWLKILFFALLLVLLAYLIGFLIQNWILGFILFVFGSLVLASLFQFFRFENIKDVISLKP